MVESTPDTVETDVVGVDWVVLYSKVIGGVVVIVVAEGVGSDEWTSDLRCRV